MFICKHIKIYRLDIDRNRGYRYLDIQIIISTIHPTVPASCRQIFWLHHLHAANGVAWQKVVRHDVAWACCLETRSFENILPYAKKMFSQTNPHETASMT